MSTSDHSSQTQDTEVQYTSIPTSEFMYNIDKIKSKQKSNSLWSHKLVIKELYETLHIQDKVNTMLLQV
jgi:hypothetical protein